jgi:hypothetical protein
VEIDRVMDERWEARRTARTEHGTKPKRPEVRTTR